MKPAGDRGPAKGKYGPLSGKAGSGACRDTKTQATGRKIEN